MSLTMALSVLILALLMTPTDGPTQVKNRNFCRLLISSPICFRTFKIKNFQTIASIVIVPEITLSINKKQISP